MTDVEDALRWLARSGGTLRFASVGMAGAAPAHANAGYTVEATVEGASPTAARTFLGSYEARTAGLSPAVARVVAHLMGRPDPASPAALPKPPARPAFAAAPAATARAA